jgi:hypothetical protein
VLNASEAVAGGKSLTASGASLFAGRIIAAGAFGGGQIKIELRALSGQLSTDIHTRLPWQPIK